MCESIEARIAPALKLFAWRTKPWQPCRCFFILGVWKANCFPQWRQRHWSPVYDPRSTSSNSRRVSWSLSLPMTAGGLGVVSWRFGGRMGPWRRRRRWWTSRGLRHYQLRWRRRTTARRFPLDRRRVCIALASSKHWVWESFTEIAIGLTLPSEDSPGDQFLGVSLGPELGYLGASPSKI